MVYKKRRKHHIKRKSNSPPGFDRAMARFRGSPPKHKPSKLEKKLRSFEKKHPRIARELAGIIERAQRKIRGQTWQTQ